MPTPEVPEQRPLSDKERYELEWKRAKMGFFNESKNLMYYIENYQVEGIINELSVLINPSDFPKKGDLWHYISVWKLWSNENIELEKMARYMIYGTYETLVPMLENPWTWKLKYILDNHWRDIKIVLKEIQNKENEMKPKVTEKPKEEKKEEWFFDWAVDWLKQWISDVYNYGVDKLSSLWNATTKLIPSGVKNWVKENLFSPEKQKNTESINEIYNKLKWKEKPDFFPFYLAMQWYNKEKNSLKNKKYLTVVDYSRPVSQNRLYVINMDTLTVENCVPTWHGKNSGNQQRTTRFSNVPESKQTSIWFFRTPMDYQPNSKYIKTRWKHGWRGLFLTWMETSNNNAPTRWIAVHPVWEFFYGSTKNGHKAGESTSEGCITIRSVDHPTEIMDKIRWDSLIYSYYPDMKYLNESKLIK